MIIQSKAIVIKSFPYGDSSLISRVLIENGQKLSIMIKGAKSLKSNKTALFQSLNLIQMNYYHKDNRDMQLFKEGNLLDNFSTVKKTFESMKFGLCMIDIIDKALPKDYEDKFMFDILYQCLVQMDNNKDYKMVFVFFLLLFSHHNGYSVKELEIDVLEDNDISKIFTQSDIAQNQYEKLLHSMNQSNTDDLIQQLLLFIRTHIPEIKNVKSLKFVN